MRRATPFRSPSMVLLIGLFVVAQPAPSFAENHYSQPHNNCRIDDTVSLPRTLTGTIQTPPSWLAWYLRNNADLVFVQGNNLIALNPVTGVKTTLGNSITLDHQVVAGSGPSGIYALTAPRLGGASTDTITLKGYAADTYQLLWSKEPLNGVPPMITSPLATANEIFLGAGNKVTLLNAANGEPLWSRTLGFLVGTKGALSNQVLVLPNTLGIDALALGDGQTLWHHPMSPASFNPSRSITIEGNKIYAPLTNQTVSALDLSAGTVLWESAPIPSGIDFRHPVIAGAAGVIVPTNGGLARLSATGSLLWNQTYAFLRLRQISPSILWTANAVFIGGADGIYALSPDTGTVLWSKTGLGQIASIEYFAPVLVAVDLQGAMHKFSP